MTARTRRTSRRKAKSGSSRKARRCGSAGDGLDAIIRSLPGYDPFDQAGDCWFDRAAALDAIAFIEECIKLAKGTHDKSAGTPFLLERWQKAIVANLFGWKRPDGTRRYRECLIYVAKKNGKMLGLDTPLPTPSGWTTIGELRDGDTIFDERGKPCRVVKVHPIDPRPESYLVTFSNGEKIKACGGHLWLTTALVDRPGAGVGTRQKALFAGTRKGAARFKTRLRTTREIFETLTAQDGAARNHSIPMPGALELPERKLPVDPYVLGVWLGDGTTASASLTCAASDVEILDHIRAAGVAARIREYRRTPTVLTVSIGSIDTCPRGHDAGEYRHGHCLACARELDRARRHGRPRPTATHKPLQVRLREIGLLGNKHVPAPYLRASASQRLALVQGLMDTDGSVSKAGQCEFSNCNEALVDQFRELLATLGIKATAIWRETIGNPSCRVTFHTDRPVFRLSRKLRRLKKSVKRARTVQVVSVEPIPPEPMRCITVDSPSGLYLCGRTMLPTHNTALAAAILLLVLVTDHEPGAELYSAAASRDQAALIFSHAVGMIRQEKELSSRLTIYGAKGGSQQKSICYDAQHSAYKCLSADANTADGVNPHFAIIDELHRHADPELAEVLQKSTAARAQPLVIYTTTADYNRPSLCNTMLKRARQVRDNKGDAKRIGYDPGFLPVVYEATKDDDFTDPDVWKKANPNLGVTLTEEFLARECKKAEETPSELNNYLRLHLNIVTDAAEAWLRMDRWNRCAGLKPDETPEQWRKRKLEELRGRECFLGMDLSAKIDLTAVAQIFRPLAPKEPWIIIPHLWVPAVTAHEKEKNDRVPYAAWARAGFVTLTDGDEIDSQAIRAAANQINDVYPVREVGYDDWNATELSRQLREEDGFGEKMVIVRQGSKSLSDPMKEFEAMVMSGRIEHGANPAMDWMIGNLCVKRDENGNLQPDKKKSSQKIDGPVATFSGLARALASGDGAPSVYESRGILEL